MMGFNMPVGQYTPEMLVEMAKGSFRPPGAGGMGGGGGQAAPGFNVGQAGAGLGGLASMLGGGISNAGPQGSGAGGAYTPADAMGMANKAGLGGNGLGGIDSEIANWSAYGAGVPSGGMSSASGALGMPDFLTGAWRGITGFLGGR